MKISISSCDKKCPFPFTKMRKGTECVCDCRDDRSLKCLEIKYGIEPLRHNEFKLVNYQMALIKAQFRSF